MLQSNYLQKQTKMHDIVVLYRSIRPKKEIVFSCNGPEINRVGRSVKQLIIFLSKMCVLCIFYVD